MKGEFENWKILVGGGMEANLKIEKFWYRVYIKITPTPLFGPLKSEPLAPPTKEKEPRRTPQGDKILRLGNAAGIQKTHSGLSYINI